MSFAASRWTTSLLAQPNVLAEMVESGLVELAWLTPAEADYAYTEITSDHGFTTEVAADTLTFDNTVSEGEDLHLLPHPLR